MNLTDVYSIRQVEIQEQRKTLCQNLRHVLKVINAEYQQIDWEDRAFLNRIVNEALEILEPEDYKLCQ